MTDPLYDNINGAIMIVIKYLFKSIPGNRNLLINLNGDIIANEKSIELPKKERFGRVSIELFNSIRKVDIEWLKYIAWYEFPDIEELIFDTHFISVDKAVLKINVDKIPSFIKPKFYNKIYRIIPTTPRYGISEDGDVYDSVADRIFKASKDVPDEKTYPRISVYVPDKNTRRFLGIHRLLALAWIPNDGFKYKPFINHKDGNKLNFDLNNLEWCSQKENLEHAVSNDLITSVVKCRVFDIITLKTVEFKSIRRASEFIYNGAKTRILMSENNYNKLYNKRYEIRFNDDYTPWTFVNQNQAIDYPGHIFYVYDKKTAETTIIYGLENFRNKFKLWKLSHRIKSFLEKAIKDNPDLVITHKLNKTEGPYEVYDTITNKISLFYNIRDISEHLEVHFDRIRRLVKHGIKMLLLNRYAIRIKNDDSFNIEEYYKFNGNTIKAVSVYTKDNVFIKTFDSIRATSEELRISRLAIQKAIKSKKILINKYYVKLVS
jgi:hypothetical protein